MLLTYTPSSYLQESKKRLTTEVERLIQQHEVIVLNNSRLEQENMQRAERIALLTSKPQLTVEDIGATAPLYAQYGPRCTAERR